MSEENHHSMALPPGYQLGDYRIDSELGHGGFGITYRACEVNIGKIVAIKEYLPRDLAYREEGITVAPISERDEDLFYWGLERFLDEAKILARFQHPNIVGVHRFFKANGTAYFVMDYCQGDSLDTILEREERLDPKRIMALVEPLLDALEQLHEAGIIHRDIKPGNIFIRYDNTPLLLDFGSARQALGERSQSATAVVSPPYAAYEQYSTRAHQGAYTDIYCFSATLYRCITCGNVPDATDRMLADTLKPLVASSWTKEYPASLLQAIDIGLSVRAQDRPQSIAMWREAFQGAANLNPDETETPSCKPKSSRVAMCLKWVVAIVLFAAAGVVGWNLLDSPITSPSEWQAQGELRGHEGSLNAVTYVDGNRALTASNDGTVRLWHLDTRAEAHRFEHGGPVRAMAYHADRGEFVTGDNNGTLRVWCLDSEKMLYVLGRHDSAILDVAFLPDGKHVVSGGSRDLMMWRLEDQRVMWSRDATSKTVFAVSVSPNSQIVASAENDGQIRLWDAGSGRPKQPLKGHGDAVRAISFAPSSDALLLSGSDDTTARVWHLDSGVDRHVLRDHDFGVDAVSWYSEDYVLTGSVDRRLRVWSVNEARITRTFPEHDSAIRSIAVAPDGSGAISAAGNVAVVWGPDD